MPPDLAGEAARLSDRVAALAPWGRRRLVAIVGPPGAGKSSLAAAMIPALAARDLKAVLVPMDGFHLDNAVLEERGLIARKGAPESFDAGGFVRAVERLGAEDEVILPEFDRGADLSRAGRIVVGPRHEVAVVEGNYLVLPEPPWDALVGRWDLVHFIDVPRAELRRRLMHRWLSLGHGEDAAALKVDGNDLPNADRVIAGRPAVAGDPG